jgi:3-methylfumaryl-CoA hydratase
MQIEPDAVQLFRYSALTFNGHRIHYDRSYANKVEGYPGLIVHGPLIATLLTELIRRELPDRKIVEFSFRALSPVFDTAPFSVHGNLSHDGGNVALWAANEQGALAVQAQARLA